MYHRPKLKEEIASSFFLAMTNFKFRLSVGVKIGDCFSILPRNDEIFNSPIGWC
ncbi:hypothetical protein ACFOG5_09780 [Pedobacter fastidiosus]|uniref:hypothetical protein n=1 Tax=Pedobacter fastidiosus TaxID=2765361 RepID=UPI003609DC6A